MISNFFRQQEFGLLTVQRLTQSVCSSVLETKTIKMLSHDITELDNDDLSSIKCLLFSVSEKNFLYASDRNGTLCGTSGSFGVSPCGRDEFSGRNDDSREPPGTNCAVSLAFHTKQLPRLWGELKISVSSKCKEISLFCSVLSFFLPFYL